MSVSDRLPLPNYVPGTWARATLFHPSRGNRTGNREQARHLRQIAAGSLKAENGFWLVPQLAPIPKLTSFTGTISDAALTLQRSPKLSKTEALRRILIEHVKVPFEDNPAHEKMITTSNAKAIVQCQRAVDPAQRVRNAALIAKPYDVTVSLDENERLSLLDRNGNRIWTNT